MSERSIEVLQNVAKTYEELLVPALFGEWPSRLADEAQIGLGQNVLDVACGTGILARTVAARVGASGSVSGLDINPRMLDVARHISPALEWEVGSAQSLPHRDDSFDAVLCQFALMLFAEPVTALREMRRVLKRDGQLGIAVFASIDSIPAYGQLADIYERLIDKNVGDVLRLPFSVRGTDQLASLFAAANLRRTLITTHEGRAHFSSVRQMVLSDAYGWFPFADIHLDEHMIETVVRQAEQELEPFRTVDRAVEFRVPVHIVTAMK